MELCDKAFDMIDKVNTPRGRAGSTIERIGKLVESGMPPPAIAIMMTANSKNGHHYTNDHVEAARMMWEDCVSRPLIKSSEAKAALKEQNLCNAGFQPA